MAMYHCYVSWLCNIAMYHSYVIYFIVRRQSSSVVVRRPSSSVVVVRPSSSVRRRPSSSVVVVVRRPSSSVVVRPSSVVVRPSIVVRRRQAANPRPHAIFRKKKQQNASPTAMGLWNSESTTKCCRFLGSNLKKVSRKHVLWMIYSSIRCLVPMFMLMFFVII